MNAFWGGIVGGVAGALWDTARFFDDLFLKGVYDILIISLLMSFN